jgi:hypothetical protein
LFENDVQLAIIDWSQIDNVRAEIQIDVLHDD